MESVLLLVCLLGTKTGGEKKKIPPWVEQFPKHIWSVFLKWLSSNLCAFCVYLCVYAADAFCWWCCQCCWHLGCIPESLQAKDGDDISLLAQTCTHTRRAAFPSPRPSFLLSCEALLGCLSSSRNRECVTKHILSDSHAIFPWCRPRLLFMVGLPATLRRRLLWTLLLPCGKEGGCIA